MVSSSFMVPAPTPTPAKVRCRPIQDADLGAVADLLTQGFPTRSRKYWTNGLAAMRRRASPDDCPRYGYLLETDGAAVGALILIFTAMGAGQVRCNVSSWYVAPEFRAYASVLVSHALKLKHVTYMNISAAEPTWPILKAQGYTRYTEGQFVCAPALAASQGVRARAFNATRDAQLCDFETIRAHADAGCLAFVCETPDGPAPFLFVRRRMAYAPLGVVQLVYCRGPESFLRCAGALGRALLLRGAGLVICDADAPPPGLVGRFFQDKTPRFFRGPHRPGLNDLAFTELVLFGP
jgi:hypothetical protein